MVQFDNTYSWARSKSVYYNIDVMEADKAAELDLNGITKEGQWGDHTSGVQDTDKEYTKL